MAISSIAVDCDMDSLIFIQARADTLPISTGNKFGDLHSKLKYEQIAEFVSDVTKITRTG